MTSDFFPTYEQLIAVAVSRPPGRGRDLKKDAGWTQVQRALDEAQMGEVYELHATHKSMDIMRQRLRRVAYERGITVLQVGIGNRVFWAIPHEQDVELTRGRSL